jgi:hypothetical protein
MFRADGCWSVEFGSHETPSFARHQSPPLVLMLCPGRQSRGREPSARILHIICSVHGQRLVQQRYAVGASNLVRWLRHGHNGRIGSSPQAVRCARREELSLFGRDHFGANYSGDRKISEGESRKVAGTSGLALAGCSATSLPMQVTRRKPSCCYNTLASLRLKMWLA